MLGTRALGGIFIASYGNLLTVGDTLCSDHPYDREFQCNDLLAAQRC